MFDPKLMEWNILLFILTTKKFKLLYILVTDLAPLKYNSKLMNSIWGIYNRYSPHNIKKTNDDVSPAYGDLQK